MSTMDDVPSHWISKASIAKRIGISRVTVDKQLIRIEKDKELSGRLNVLVVDEGKRKLYFYDPSDVDAVFSELQKKSRRKSSGVKRTNSRVNDNVKLLDDAIVKLELQKEELKVIALEKEVARLEDNLKDLRGENTFLKAQLTDQRPNSASTAPEPIKEEVVPNKPATIAEIKEAVADVDKSNVGPEDDKEAVLLDEYLALSEKIDSGTYSDRLEEAVEAVHIFRFLSIGESHSSRIITRWGNRARKARYECLFDLTVSASNEMKEGEFHKLLKGSVKHHISHLAFHSDGYGYVLDSDTNDIIIKPPLPLHLQKEIEEDKDRLAGEEGKPKLDDDRVSIVDCRVKVSTAMSFENDLPDTHTDNVWMVLHRDKTSDDEETIIGAFNIEEPDRDDDLITLMLKVGVKDDVVLTDALRSHPTAYQTWMKAFNAWYKIHGPTDAELEEQSKLQKEEDTQPTSEAPKDTEKEARRDSIAPKAEPKQVQKKGFWNWLKGY